MVGVHRKDDTDFYATREVKLTQSGYYNMLTGGLKKAKEWNRSWWNANKTSFMDFRKSRGVYYRVLLLHRGKLVCVRVGRFIRKTGGLVPSISVDVIDPPDYWHFIALFIVAAFQLGRFMRFWFNNDLQMLIKNRYRCLDIFLSVWLLCLISYPFILFNHDMSLFQNDSKIGEVDDTPNY